MDKSASLIAIPGVCSGHPEHPELLWLFRKTPEGLLQFEKLEIDFSQPEKYEHAALQTFDVSMQGFEGCPYCEAELYFFCKSCKHLCCFSWEQVETSGLWHCQSCQAPYRMRPKTTPFRVEASVLPETKTAALPAATNHSLRQTLARYSPFKK